MKYVSEKAQELIETRKEDCKEAIIDALADLQARQDQMRAAFETYHALRSLNLDYPVTDKYKVRVDYDRINAMRARLAYCPYEKFPIIMQLDNGYARLKAKDNSLYIEVKPEYTHTLSVDIDTERVNMEIYGKSYQITAFVQDLKEFAQAISEIAE